MEPIYSSMGLDYFFDQNAHVLAGTIFERMGINPEYRGCIFDQNSGERVVGAMERVPTAEGFLYLIGVRRDLTGNPELLRAAVETASHECGHVYMREKWPYLDKLLFNLSKMSKVAHRLRERIADKIAKRYAEGLINYNTE